MTRWPLWTVSWRITTSRGHSCEPSSSGSPAVRGVIQLRQLIEIAHALSESPGESATRLVIIDAGLPAPELQHWVTVNGVPTYRLDLAYPAHRVAVEYDGREFHDSPEQRARDAARRRWLREHGWTVIVVTKDDLASGSSRWLDLLARELRLA